MKKVILFSLLISMSSIALAQTRDYAFSQSGFAEGAEVTGSFTGFDSNGDGQLVGFGGLGEISAFSMSFSGNSIVDPFSMGIDDLFGLVYDLDGGPLGDGVLLAIEGVRSVDATFLYEAGPGPFGGAICGTGVDCARVTQDEAEDFSQELVQVTALAIEPVPFSPAMLVLLALLLGAIGIRNVSMKSHN